MIRVVGVRFRTAGKIYYFDPLEFELHRDSHVIVETARGIEFGTVVGDIKELEEEKVPQPLKPVLRIASEKDEETNEENRIKEKEAYKTCLIKIAIHGLDMKLIDCEYTFDNNKILFYFTSDGRVDFRELVKDLASEFRTRIELRQVGVRDETKMLGGFGSCGRVLCCHGHLSDFIPVSIKMAKEQGLSLNPTKISGVCGRLMCCLKHEQETYEELNKRLPRNGDFVTASDGTKGVVHSVSALREIVHVTVDNNGTKEVKDYPASELTYKRGQKHEETFIEDEDIDEAALAALEDKPGDVSLNDGDQPQKKEFHKGNKRDGQNFKENFKENRKEFHKEFHKGENKEHHKEGHKDNFKENFKENHKEFHKEGHKDGQKEFHKDGQKEFHKEFHKDGFKKKNGYRKDFKRGQGKPQGDGQ